MDSDKICVLEVSDTEIQVVEVAVLENGTVRLRLVEPAGWVSDKAGTSGAQIMKLIRCVTGANSCTSCIS